MISPWPLRLQETRTLSGHDDSVRSVAFSPFGDLLASAAKDGTVRLWNWRTGAELKKQTLGPTNGSIAQVTFTPDGRHLVTANSNGTMYVLRLEHFKKGKGN